VPVPWGGPDAFNSPDVEPQFGNEVVLEDIVHGVMTVPATNNKHRVLDYYCSVAESTEWDCALNLDPLPLVVVSL